MGLGKMKALLTNIFNLFILILFLSGCSVDTKTGFWEDKNDFSSKKDLSSLSFNENLSFEEYKKNIITYGKKSNYPKLMDWYEK